MSPTSATVFRKCQLRSDGRGYWGQVTGPVDHSDWLVGAMKPRPLGSFWCGFGNQVLGFPPFFFFTFLFLFHSFIFLLFFRLASFVFFLVVFLDTSPKAIKILNISFYLHFYSCILYFFSLLSSLFSVPDIRKEPPNIKFKNELKMKDVPYVSGPRSK